MYMILAEDPRQMLKWRFIRECQLSQKLDRLQVNQMDMWKCIFTMLWQYIRQCKMASKFICLILSLLSLSLLDCALITLLDRAYDFKYFVSSKRQCLTTSLGIQYLCSVLGKDVPICGWLSDSISHSWPSITQIIVVTIKNTDVSIC